MIWKLRRKTAGEWSTAAVVAEIAEASRSGRQPRFGRDDRDHLAEALDELMKAGDDRAAEVAARALHRLSPDSSYARRVFELFDRAPGASESSSFTDDATKDVQVVRRPGSDIVVFAFCGGAHRLGMPLCLAHRWLARLPAHVVYLRDFHRTFYLRGITSLGPDREATVAALREIAASLGAHRIACLGNSGGVFAALLYGLDLGAARVVGLSGPTNLSPGFNTHLRLANLAQRLAAVGRDVEIDLRGSYAGSTAPPKTLLTFGAENWDDQIQAGYLAGLPSVTLAPIAGVRDHNIATALARRGEFPRILQWLVESG
jgi:hypothetical protein